MTEKINVNPDKSEGLVSKVNLLHGNFNDNSLLPSNDSLNKKASKDKEQNRDKEISNSSIKKLSVRKQRTENESINNNSKTSSKRNKKTYKEIDSSSANRSLLILEEKNYEEKKKKLSKQAKKEKRYIVDNIDNIFSKLNKPKIKLYIQEILLYIIVFNICIYFWIFLFISRSKIERNYCFGRLSQVRQIKYVLIIKVN